MESSSLCRFTFSSFAQNNLYGWSLETAWRIVHGAEIEIERAENSIQQNQLLFLCDANSHTGFRFHSIRFSCACKDALEGKSLYLESCSYVHTNLCSCCRAKYKLHNSRYFVLFYCRAFIFIVNFLIQLLCQRKNIY
jgi:hypothetical protein